MSRFFAVLFLSLGLTLGVAQIPFASTQEQNAPAMASEVKTLVETNNEFAFDLYQKLSKTEGNLIFSPHSVANALAIILNGAKGDTADEIAKTLKIKSDTTIFNAALSTVGKSIQANANSNKSEFSIANGFWSDPGLGLRPTFVDVGKETFGAEFQALDLAGDSEGARLIVNKWAASKTKGRIQDMLKPGAIDDVTRFILVNAIYFQGTWWQPFPKEATKDQTFLASFKDAVRIPMMKTTLLTTCHISKNVVLLEIPYVEKRLSFLAFLPASQTDFHTFEAAFNLRVFNDLCGLTKQHIVDLSLPRFRVQYRTDLKEPLGQVGIRNAFSALKADLSGIGVSQQHLFLKTAIHSAFLETTEEGTEAAAATPIIGGSLPIAELAPITRVQIVLDRPFFFTIRDNSTGALLFLGRLMNPSISQ